MATSRFWYFSITDNEDSNIILQTMRILDQDATHADHVNKIFYGFRHHGGGFAIEGYITFKVKKDLNFVHGLLTIFGLNTINAINDGICFHSFLICHSIFTKGGQAWDEDIITLDVEWHYNELAVEQVGNPDWNLFD